MDPRAALRRDGGIRGSAARRRATRQHSLPSRTRRTTRRGPTTALGRKSVQSRQFCLDETRTDPKDGQANRCVLGHIRLCSSTVDRTPMSDHPNVSSDDEVPAAAAALLREVAEHLESHIDAIAEMMVTTQRAEIPAYRDMDDESLIADVRTISVTVVRMWLTVMATGKPIDATMLTPIVEGARRRVLQGVDIESLLRAYRVGIRVMWTEIVNSPGWQGRVPHAAMAPVATWVLTFSDVLSTTVASAYIDESAQLAREQEH